MILDNMPAIEGIPDEFVGKGFKQIKSSEKLDEIVKICKEFTARKLDKKCLVMFGSYGSGKTHLACAIAQNYYPYIGNQLLKQIGNEKTYCKAPMKSNVIYFHSNMFFSLMSSVAQNGGVKELEIEKLVKSHHLIVLDDLREDLLNKSDVKINTLFTLVDAINLQHKCKLILTFNFHVNKLKNVDGALFSRIAEMSKSLHFDLPDYRMK